MAKLTEQLQDKEKALEAANAVKPFRDNYKAAAGKSLGDQTGKIAARLSLAIPHTAIVYFFGANHPLVAALLRWFG